MLLHGDCLILLKEMEDNSVDSIVTDPPYGLGFMGKEWDTFDDSQFGKAGEEGENDLKVKKNFKILPRYNSDGLYDFSLNWAKKCYRVLKPGGHILSFVGTRTYHKIAAGIEDAGFEIRDMIEWVYGSGFPKSLNIGKAVDKKPRADNVKDWKKWLDIQINNCGKSKQQINDECGFTATSYVKTDNKDYWSSNLPKNGKWQIMKKIIGITTDEYDWVEQDNCEERGYVEPTGGLAGGSGNTVGCFTGKQLSNNAIDERAKQWNGWGTALKPAHEPICMARKPLSEKTVAENCLNWRTGGINIDECRLEVAGRKTGTKNPNAQKGSGNCYQGSDGKKQMEYDTKTQGRFPANLIHDNSEEVRECFPDNRPSSKCDAKDGFNDSGDVFKGDLNTHRGQGYYDNGNASRFFKSIKYCAKASKSERNKGCEGLEEKRIEGQPSFLDEGGHAKETGKPNKPIYNRNRHPTVKPVALMQYLVKMITPKGGTVLDPFMGSGSTGCACVLEGFDFIGIEMEKEYITIAEARINYWQNKEKQIKLKL